METCKKCESNLNGNYCSNCGHPVELQRINRKYILDEIGSVLNFEKGIFHSIKELFIRPGNSVKAFILEDRKRLVKPILFVIVCSLLYSLSNQFFQVEDGYINYTGEDNSATLKIFSWIQSNYGYANIIMSVFIALWLKMFFRKFHYNFFEILILLCFVMGIGMLIFSLFVIIEGLTKIHLMQISGMLGIIYCSWAIGQFFEKKIKSYLKAFFAYILGFLSFTVLAILIGTIIDQITKQ